MGHNKELEQENSTDSEASSYRSIGSVSRRTILGTSAYLGALSLTSNPVYATTSSKGLVDDRSMENNNNKIDISGKGMVVSNHSTASNVGANVLRNGGTTIDAVVAVHFALNVVEPPMSGIGGGGTMVYYDANEDDVLSLDFYLRAPSAVTPKYWIGEGGASLPDRFQSSSGLSVAVPGTVKGLKAAHDQFGTCSWEELLTPVINLANGGVVIDNITGPQIEENWHRFNDAAKEVFSGPDGNPLEAGDLLVQRDLAYTLRLIRDKGAAGFYQGEVAKALAETVQHNRGKMTVEDLRTREVWFDEPMHGEFRGVDLYNPRLPITAGFLVPPMLKHMERLEVSEKYGVQSWQKHHLFAESAGLPWADRAKYLGDPEYVNVPVEGLQSESYQKKRGAKISINSTLADYDDGECVEPGNPWAYQSSEKAAGLLAKTAEVSPIPDGESHTTHFAVADNNGNMAAVTTSLNWGMGSGIMVPDYGFMLNNYLILFDTEPGGPNQPNGGKGPLSSTSATIAMKDGKPYFTSGTPTGTTIPQTTVQVILNVVGYGMGIDEAVHEPRITTKHCPPIEWEDEVHGREGIPDDVRAKLAELGHVWTEAPGSIGRANNLLTDNGTYFGGDDPRGDGVAVGVSDI